MQQTGQKFTKESRLLTSRDFSEVFNAKKKFFYRDQAFVILAIINQFDTSRLGLIVPKKHVSLAVTRNLYKRLVREVFRKLHNELLTPNGKCLDFVVLIQPKSPPREANKPLNKGKDYISRNRQLFVANLETAIYKACNYHR